MDAAEILSKANLKEFANALELYVDEIENVLIIPKSIMNKEGNKIYENLTLAKKLISEIRKGNTNIFKDPDEWDEPWFDE